MKNFILRVANNEMSLKDALGFTVLLFALVYLIGFILHTMGVPIRIN